jgi:ribosomal-protein-alanine N-acetyltransferase
MDTFPILLTPRLVLRQLRADDIPSLVKYANNKKIAYNVINIPYPYHEHEAVFRISYVLQGFKTRARYVFAIIARETDELIGEIGIHLVNNDGLAQLGYWVGEPFWNRGIATEAMHAVLKFGFERLGLLDIFATVHIDNPASGTVALRCGLKAGNTNGNITYYNITKQAYESAAANSSTI